MQTDSAAGSVHEKVTVPLKVESSVRVTTASTVVP